ncbi:MAG: N-acetylmuramoyl-L-alanine amidase [Acetatifactor sp.]
MAWRRRRRPGTIPKVLLIVSACVLALVLVFVLLKIFIGKQDESKVQGAFASGASEAGTKEPQQSQTEDLTTKTPGNVVLELPEQEKVNIYVPEHEGIPLIVIDPGHGGYDVGSNVGTCLEKEINLAIAMKTRDRLMEMGYVVILTREDDSHLYLSDRTDIANDIKADVCVSIHQNYFEQTDIKGVETWYGSDDSQELAALIQEKVVAYTQTRSRSVQEGDLHMVRETFMPSCLIETGFISNPEERENLLDAEYQNKVATGIAEGIDIYFRRLKESN